MNALKLHLSPDQLEPLVQHIIELVTEQLRAEWSPWLDRKRASDYLGVPVSRLEKDRTVPCHRWDGRVLYDRRELDAWMRGQ